MAPLMVLFVAAISLWALGAAGVAGFRDISTVLRTSLGLMFLLTASAHWGKRRPDLIRMVPTVFPRPDVLVTITGVLELLGAIGLFLPTTARAAAICLAVMLIAIFPANIRAAHEKLTIGGKGVPTLPLRLAMQIVFVGALAGVAWLAA